MPFAIDHNRCASCGSCASICQNRAVVKREGGYRVTAMCCDCGTCIPFCPTGAIGTGKTAVEFDHKKLDTSLKEKLSLQRNIAAMKFADQPPPDVPIEEGPQFWCAICGTVFEGTGGPVFFTAEATVCGGSAMIGVGAGKSTRDEFEAAVNYEVVGEGNLFATKAEMSRARDFYPKYPKAYRGMIIGSLGEVSMPDIILFPVTGRQMCMITTAYTYETGEIMSGYGGSATCMITVAIPFLQNRPVFTSGDYSGRDFLQLTDEEIVVCFPYKLVPGLVSNLDKTAYAQSK